MRHLASSPEQESTGCPTVSLTLSDSGLSPVGHSKALLEAVTLQDPQEPSKSPFHRSLGEAESPAVWCPWLDDIHGFSASRVSCDPP